MTREEALRFRKSIEQAASLQSDEAALDNIYLYPAWQSGLTVSIGERYRYGDTLYKCVQAHTTQSDWTPDVTPALWSEVSIEEWPELVVPIPSTNPYMSGDKVTYNGRHYICVMDNTVWTPDEYAAAWNLVE